MGKVIIAKSFDYYHDGFTRSHYEEGSEHDFESSFAKICLDNGWACLVPEQNQEFKKRLTKPSKTKRVIKSTSGAHEKQSNNSANS